MITRRRYRNEFTPDMMDGATVFVFGSNTEGVHGAGAAREAAKHWGAKRGKGSGLCNSSYAIPTKASWRDKRGLPLDCIRDHVDTFLKFARAYPSFVFLVTPIGTGYAGYTHAEIAPMFKNAPTNCIFVEAWKEFLEE